MACMSNALSGASSINLVTGEVSNAECAKWKVYRGVRDEEEKEESRWVFEIHEM